MLRKQMPTLTPSWLKPTAATTSFGYEVFVLPRGGKPDRSAHPVVSLYGAIRNDHAYGANLRWTSDDTLVVEYLDAQNAIWLNGSLAVNGRVINVIMKSGVNDPTAPAGGMLYNLQGRPRGAVEQIVEPERRERVSHQTWCGEGCVKLRHRQLKR